MKQLPYTAVDLIDVLNREYPARCIRSNESPSEAHRYAGMRELIEYLITLRERVTRSDKVLE